jgi:hypothetical protein
VVNSLWAHYAYSRNFHYWRSSLLSSDWWIWTYGISVCEWRGVNGRGALAYKVDSARFSECRSENAARISYETGEERPVHLHILSPELFFSQSSIKFSIKWDWSRDSSVGIATDYGLDDQGGGSSSPGSVKHLHFSISSRPALGSTQPPIKWVPGVNRQGREADHSPPTSAEVKKMWIYTSTPPYVFMV